MTSTAKPPYVNSGIPDPVVDGLEVVEPLVVVVAEVVGVELDVLGDWELEVIGLEVVEEERELLVASEEDNVVVELLEMPAAVLELLEVVEVVVVPQDVVVDTALGSKTP